MTDTQLTTSLQRSEICDAVKSPLGVDVVDVVCVDVSFMACLPSVLAASSISAAVSGLLGHVWCRHVNLLLRLRQLTNSDIVSHSACTWSWSQLTASRCCVD